jgi:hypothetical protein
MAIKNKDGSIYEVRKPNPLMKNQDTWQDFKTHNMKIDGSIVEKLQKKYPIDNKIQIGTTQIVSTKNDKVEVIKIDIEGVPQPTEFPLPTLPPPEFPKIIKKINTDDIEAKNIQRPDKINPKIAHMPRNIVNCLLAKIETKYDSLYEDKGVKIRYSKEIAFEAIILEENDIEFNFWTHLDYITRKSVVYPMNRDKRWWKIEEIIKAPQGYFCSCTPSDLQPNFKK